MIHIKFDVVAKENMTDCRDHPQNIVFEEISENIVGQEITHISHAIMYCKYDQMKHGKKNSGMKKLDKILIHKILNYILNKALP